jgi:hypothetical protein
MRGSRRSRWPRLLEESVCQIPCSSRDIPCWQIAIRRVTTVSESRRRRKQPRKALADSAYQEKTAMLPTERLGYQVAVTRAGTSRIITRDLLEHLRFDADEDLHHAFIFGVGAVGPYRQGSSSGKKIKDCSGGKFAGTIARIGLQGPPASAESMKASGRVSAEWYRRCRAAQQHGEGRQAGRQLPLFDRCEDRWLQSSFPSQRGHVHRCTARTPTSETVQQPNHGNMRLRADTKCAHAQNVFPSSSRLMWIYPCCYLA